MNTFVFILCIVAIVVGADTIQKIYKVRASKQEQDVGTDEEASAKLISSKNAFACWSGS